MPFLTTISSRNAPLFYAGIAIFCLMAFAIDWQLPVGAAVGFLYVAAVLACLWSATLHLVPIVAGTATLFIIAGFFTSPPASIDSVTAVAVLNRVASVSMVWLTAALCIIYKSRSAAMLAAQMRLQQSMDVANVILVMIGADERVQSINRYACQLLGYSENEFIGANWFDLCIPPTDREKLRSAFREFTAGTIILRTHENPLVTRAGEERLFTWTNVAVRDADGKIIGALSSGVHITEQRRAEMALEQSHRDLADFKYALDHSAIVAITDRQGVITYVNDKFCEISGYTREELIGQTHRIVSSGTHPREFFRDMWRSIGHGEIWRNEICNRAKDGSLYWVDTTVVPFLDETGKPWQYLAIRSDITKRHLAEIAIREQTSLAKLGKLAAIVAHEVRNPLAGIRGAIQIIQGRLPAGTPEREISGEIIARIDALNSLVQDLLQFARPRPLALSPTHVAPLLADVVKLLAADPQFKAIALDVAPHDAQLLADAAQLKNVLSNLLLNAAQAISAASSNGHIRIEVRNVGTTECEIEIADDGPGIAPDILAQVFEPFFSTRHRGTGLGLSIVRQIIEGHHGHVDIRSTPGQGTTVTLRLPLAPDDEISDTVRPAPSADTG